MKILTYLLSISFLILINCEEPTVVQADGPVVVTSSFPKNGDFEENLKDWFGFGVDISTVEPHGDLKALYIDNSKAIWSSVDQFVTIPAGASKLTLSGWMKSENVVAGTDSWEKGQISFEYMDSNFEHVNPYVTAISYIDGTTEWTKYSETYNLISTAYAIKIYCALANASGKIWFDDIEATFLDDAGNILEPELINNEYLKKYYYVYDPENHKDSLPISSISQLGSDTTTINSLISDIESGKLGNTNSLLVMKNDSLIIEEYFGLWDKSKPHMIMSVTKSVTSMLIGIAIDKGFISSVNDPIKDYLTEYDSLFIDGRENITIKHLLMMAAGLEWDEWTLPYSDPNNPMSALYNSENSVAFSLKLPMINEPGSTFAYSGAFVNLAGEVLKQASGMSIEDFAETYLFSKINLGELYWQRQIDKRVSTSGGLELRPIDMIKIGKLIENKGVWNEVQIISPEWVEESTNNHINAGFTEYGYYWWRFKYNNTYQAAYGHGYGGQFIIVIDDLDLVIVTTAENYEDNTMNNINTIVNTVVPLFID